MNDEELSKFEKSSSNQGGMSSGKSEMNILLQYFANGILKMNATKMTEIPDSLGDLPVKTILALDFSNNAFTTTVIFDEITFPELKDLKINDNKIKEISLNFLNFHNLRSIELRNNHISSFLEIDYKEIGSFNVLPNLEHLDLSINKFTELPLITCFFKNLRTFIIANNHINSIDNFVNNSSNVLLDVFDISTNKIEKFPNKIYKIFPNLKNLNIDNNELKMIPTDLCVLGLHKISINGNPQKQIRYNIHQ